MSLIDRMRSRLQQLYSCCHLSAGVAWSSTFSYAWSLPVTWQRWRLCHSIRHSAISENPVLHANFMALCFIIRGLVPIEVLHCWNRDFRPFMLLWPWLWPDDFHVRTWPVFPEESLDSLDRRAGVQHTARPPACVSGGRLPTCVCHWTPTTAFVGHRHVPSAANQHTSWRSLSCWTLHMEHSANPATRVGHYTRTISASTKKHLFGHW